LGIAKNSNEGLELRVHPTLIPSKRLLANVNGVMNAVLVKGDAVGNTLHYGAGAGAEPTASAVVADILDIVRSIDVSASSRVPHLGFQPESIQQLPVKVTDQFESAYYLRFDVNDVAGVMSKLSAKFADQNISIDAITQKEPSLEEDFVSVIFITQRTRENLVDQAIESIESMADVRADAVKIRVEHFN
jgi:homoserine dehydrogenase